MNIDGVLRRCWAEGSNINIALLTLLMLMADEAFEPTQRAPIESVAVFALSPLRPEAEGPCTERPRSRQQSADRQCARSPSSEAQP